MSEKTANYLVYFVAGGLYVFSLSASILNCTVLTFEYAGVAWASGFFLTVLGLLFYNKYTFCTGLALFLVTAVLIGGDILLFGEAPSRYGEIWEQGKGAVLFTLGYWPYESSYSGVLVWALSGLLAIFTMLALKLRFNFPMLLGLGVGIFAINISIGFVPDYTLFIIFLFSVLTFFMKRLNVTERERDKGAVLSNGVYTLCVMPLCAVIVLAAGRMSAPAEGNGFQAVRNAVGKPFRVVSDGVYALFSPKYFSFQNTGFGGEGGRLGGNVRVNEDFVMRVSSPKGVYLSGAVKDIYTGDRWISREPQFNSLPQDFGNRREWELKDYVMGRMAVEYLEYWDRILVARRNGIDIRPLQFGRNNSVEIDYTAIAGILETYIGEVKIDIGEKRTGTIFYPSNYMDYHFPQEGRIITNGSGDIRSERLLSKGTQYSYSVFGSGNWEDIPGSNMERFVALSSGDFYEEVIEKINQIDDQYLFAMPYIMVGSQPMRFVDICSLMNKRAGEMRDRYTELPENLPQRIIDLAKTIGEENPNDYERVLALKDYLSQYRYTLTPGAVPEGEDFVDYFLFERKAGYCTSFASAFTVLCRSMGIPARYVEGFALPDSAGEGEMVDVTNANAHAWSEVYLEGFGWYRADPTPYVRESYTGLGAYGAYGSEYPGEYMEMEEYYRHLMEGEYPYESSGNSLSNEEDREESGGSVFSRMAKFVDGFRKNRPVTFYFLTSVFLLLSMGGLFILYQAVKFDFTVKNIKAHENNAAVREYFRRILRLTGYFDYGRMDRETALQYADRLGKRISFNNDKLFMRDIAEIFNKAAYGRNSVADKEREIVEEAYRQLDEKLRRKCRFPQYVYLRYVLGRV